MVAAFGLGSITHLGGGQTPNVDGSIRLDEVWTPVAAGVGAAMFHLTTHAFFKALLFLCAGSVIVGCHHEQDIFKMGGLRQKLPLTFVTFTVGVLAIIGFPGLAGFYSKDAILYLALQNNHAIFAVLAFTAVLTAFYMVRLWKLVFLGTPRSPEAEHAHEGGFALTAPLVVLAALSLVGGYGFFFDRIAGTVASLVPEAHGSAHTTILIVSLAVMLVGAGAALFLYKSATEDSLRQKAPGLFALLASKLWIDELYLYYVEKVQQRFALLLDFLEQVFLVGLIIRGCSGVVGFIGMGARALHVGNLHIYVYWFFLGVVLFWAYAAGVF
jgi:NADH-quinone oxidoreductase subunit L